MSTWNPLGNFDPTARPDPKIVAQTRTFLRTLPVLPKGSITRCFLHWTVGPLGMCFADYNAEVRYVANAWVMTLTHDPADNVPGLNDNAEASHTYMRNSNAVGLAITGMDGASAQDFGQDGVTVAGLTRLCALAAVFALAYGIDVGGTASGGPYAGEHTIFTHAEAGDHGGNPQQYAPYGPATTCERWDLDTFVPVPAGEPMPPSSVCGDALRELTHAFKVAIA